jgi:prophage DNA circulation protein
MTLRIRTQREMVELGDEEAEELRERLRLVPGAQPVEETIAVAANASTSVSFTEPQKVALLAVLQTWLDDLGAAGIGSGAFTLRNALVDVLRTSGAGEA